MLGTEGFGGSSRPGSADKIKGPLFEVDNPIVNVPGIVAVDASMNSTMFNQFVRQGDTRHVYLANSLHVAGQITGDEGILLGTAATPAGTCVVPGLLASTARGTLASCVGGVWLELNDHIITGIVDGLAHGATLSMPTCPASTETFARLSLNGVHVTATGSDVDVRGNLAGSVSGSGNVNSTGSVNVNGSFTGALQSSPSSRINVAQGVALSGNQVQISGNRPDSRASAIVGCRFL